MNSRATAIFEVTGWESTVYDEPPEKPALSRVTIKKTFRGEVEGSSTAELLMCAGADDAGSYIVQERFEGKVGDRHGSFVMHHGGMRWNGGSRVYGQVAPGSGTGDLRGIRGEVQYRHDEQGAVFTLDYDFE
jgi:hypothetical protein